MAIDQNFEQRACERFRLQPMYTTVELQALGDDGEPTCGHAYDLSESGVRIEVDDAPEIGAEVELHLGLPAEPKPIGAVGEVIWVHDAEDDPAARRLAVRFVRFESDADQTRLHDFLGMSGVRS